MITRPSGNNLSGSEGRLVEDHGNKETLAKLLRFATTRDNSESQEHSLDGYVERMQEGQDKIYYILAENYSTAVASPHLEKLQKSGTEVLLLTDRIDPWVVTASGV